jgi:hypothetical protein
MPMNSRMPPQLAVPVRSLCCLSLDIFLNRTRVMTDLSIACYLTTPRFCTPPVLAPLPCHTVGYYCDGSGLPIARGQNNLPVLQSPPSVPRGCLPDPSHTGFPKKRGIVSGLTGSVRKPFKTVDRKFHKIAVSIGGWRRTWSLPRT